MFTSKSTRGFYPSTDYPNSPADLVEITNEEHAVLLEGQSQGKVIDFDEAGRPFLTDPPAPSAEQLQAQVNAEARAYLTSTDWYVIRLQETGEPIPEGILAERAAARAQVVE